MKWAVVGLLTAALGGLLGVVGSADGDGAKGPKQRDRASSTASRPARTSDGPEDDQAAHSPGRHRDWWPRRDGRGHDGMGGSADRLRFKQGMGGRPWDEDDDEPMSPEQVTRLMDFTKQEFPKLHQRLVSVRETNPVVFRQMVRRVRGPVSEIVRVQQHDPKAARRLIDAHRIEIDLTELQGEYRAAKSDSRRQQVKSEMRELVARRCELRLERLKDEVSGLEKRLEYAKKEMAKREKDNDQIVDQELNRLLATGAKSPGKESLWSPGGAGIGPKAGRRGQGSPSTPPSDTPAPLE